MNDSTTWEWDFTPPPTGVGDAERTGQRPATGPPLPLLALAGGVAVAGATLAWALPFALTAVFGWFLAGPTALGLLAFYVQRDTAARASGLYTAPDWARVAYWCSVGLSLIAVIACAVRIADWVGRL